MRAELFVRFGLLACVLALVPGGARLAPALALLFAPQFYLASRGPELGRGGRAAWLLADVVFLCWALLRPDADPALAAACLLPALLLGFHEGPWAAAGAGALAAALLWRGEPRPAATRALLLIGLPAAAVWSARRAAADSAGRARATAATLRAAQLGEFLSFVLYQLREYLVSTTSSAQALALALKDHPAGERAERLTRLVAELNMKASRLLGDRSALTSSTLPARASFELEPLVRAAAGAAREAFAAGPVELSFHAETAKLEMSGDRRALESCLLAVLQNAFEAGAGRVAVVLRRDGPFAQVEVSDDGGGLREDQLERVFEPLYSARSGTSGLGLGLPMARRALERLGGGLRLKSREGCTAVLLSVPLSRDLPVVRNEDSSWAGRRRRA